MNTATGAHGAVERFIALIELTAAGFLAVVTALTFVSVILRYFFSWAIPDSYDLTRLLLGILIFWGMAVASYRGDHISVDLLWGVSPPWAKRGWLVVMRSQAAARRGPASSSTVAWTVRRPSSIHT